jgi:hypothetical protein
MNFENKQFKMGRFCERICMMRGDFQIVEEWCEFVNNISREFGVELNDKILLASIKLNYDGELITRVGRKNYYIVGEWNRKPTGINIDTERGGILYIEDNKIKLLKEDEIINKILQKMFEASHSN